MDPDRPQAIPRVVWRQHAFTRADHTVTDHLGQRLRDLARDRPGAFELLHRCAERLSASQAKHGPAETDNMATWRAAKGRRPTPGWKPRAPRTGFVNPRVPAVPATLDLNLEEYYAGAALMGILAAQGEEPDDDWLKKRSFRVGQAMASEAQRRRKKG